jgi:hypothetical protein
VHADLIADRRSYAGEFNSAGFFVSYFVKQNRDTHETTDISF